MVMKCCGLDYCVSSSPCQLSGMPKIDNPSTYFGIIERANVNNWLDDVMKSNSQNIVFYIYIYIYMWAG